MDTMIQKLEKYADNLENIVEQRTAQLMDEKQKTDMLLHRMLPPYAIECIRVNNCSVLSGVYIEFVKTIQASFLSITFFSSSYRFLFYSFSVVILVLVFLSISVTVNLIVSYSFSAVLLVTKIDN